MPVAIEVQTSENRFSAPVRSAARGRVLTNRARRHLHKRHKKTTAQRTWVDGFVRLGVIAYQSDWVKKNEPPSPGVERMLKRCGRRFERSGKIDLRQLDRRFWEMLFTCGWWPFARALKVKCADGTELPLPGWNGFESYYDWWTSLDPHSRDQMKDLSRAVYDGKDAFASKKRRNDKSRTR